MPCERIPSLDDPRVDPYRSLYRSAFARRSGRFVVEGVWLVERLARSDFPLESVLADERHVESIQGQIPDKIPIYVIRQEWVDELLGFPFHRGVLACAKRKEPSRLDELIDGISNESTLVVCPQITDPANLGGVIRNCAAFGVDALLLGPNCADPFSRRAVRVSMGSSLCVPIAESQDLHHDLCGLKERYNVEIIATVLDSPADSLVETRRNRATAIMIGSEGYGLEQQWLELAERRVTLPMKNGTDSLNLATASGVILYHFTHIA